MSAFACFLPPDDVQRRAWECCVVLGDGFADRLALVDRVLIEEMQHVGPAALGWADCRIAFRLYSATIAERV